MRGRAILIAGLSLLLTTSVLAELVKENLLAGLPAGYKVDFQQRQGNMVITEMVPAAESVHDWTEMATMQVFFGMKDKTPGQFRDAMMQLWPASCPGSEAHAITQGVENGYPFALWLQSCPLSKVTGKTEITWFKAIQGNDSFYVVQRAFTSMPSKEQITRLMEYFKQVYVCDSRLPDRPCPKANN